MISCVILICFRMPSADCYNWSPMDGDLVNITKTVRAARRATYSAPLQADEYSTQYPTSLPSSSNTASIAAFEHQASYPSTANFLHRRVVEATSDVSEHDSREQKKSLTKMIASGNYREITAVPSSWQLASNANQPVRYHLATTFGNESQSSDHSDSMHQVTRLSKL